MILHIVSKSDWETAQLSAEFRGDTLDTDGFIHCSKPEQVAEIANLKFSGRNDMLLLGINPGKVESEVRYEDGGNGQHYPHIYGPLNLSAVTQVVPYLADEDGTFQLPSNFRAI